MNDLNLLSNRFNIYIEDGYISGKEVPYYIKNNINKNFQLREYQIEALNSLIYYIEHYKRKIKPIHLLFNMATGSGKTLLMATNILYLYEKGYRDFIFFVNSTNIIEKTKQNFLAPSSSKYLFSENISINNRQIPIREVNNFDESDNNSINIVFTTIQGLHYKMNNPSEGSVTFEDFKDKRIVLLSDEAHHINTLTKKRLNKREREMKSSWEYTVTTILNSNPENILLEYTATIGMDNKEIYDKYKDKLIYRYDLKNYREDKYSKEITVLRSETNTKDRILQAVILSEYRRKVAEKRGISLKPVILIKSNKIDESKEIKKSFLNWIDNLNSKNIKEIVNINQDNIINKAFRYFEKEDIKIDDLLIEIKNNFSEERCIEVNSKSDSDEKQIIVNTLEDRDNPYRVVFTVDMLNEGWDVLNLFDIVRVNEGRGSKKTTINEAQLIGRGARYYPFKLEEGQDKYKRKYDEDLDNEARILENLYYHSINESKYISELKTELEKMGIVAKEGERRKINLKLKSSFKDSSLYKTGFIFSNTQEVNNNIEINSLKDMKIEEQYEYNLPNKKIGETVILDENNLDIKADNFNRDSLLISKIPKNVLRKGISMNQFYTFRNIKFYFPKISSMDEFLYSKDYLGNISITIKGEYKDIYELPNEDLLSAFLFVLGRIERQILKNYIPYKGTKEFYITPINTLKLEKPIYITMGGEDSESGKPMSIDDGSPLRLDLSKENWYAYEDNYGTSEEKSLILLIKELYDKLVDKGYKDIYLLRNEKILRLYNFEDERVMEPDFLLFTRHKSGEKEVFYQLFIESKGEQLLEKDKWKEELLLSIKDNYKAVLTRPIKKDMGYHERSLDTPSFIPKDYDYGLDSNLFENDKYKLIGLCFYNKSKELIFRDNIAEELDLKNNT